MSDTLGGIGPDSFIKWLKHLYATAALASRADGDDGSRGRFLLDDLLADLLATLVRDNVEMIDRLTIRDAP